MRRRTLIGLPLANCLASSFAASGAQSDIRAVLGSDVPSRQAFYEALVQAIPRLVLVETARMLDPSTIAVIAGAKALRDFVEEGASCFGIGLYINRLQWPSQASQNRKLSIIYSDVAISDQIKLIDKLFAGGANVGVLLSEANRSFEAVIKSEFAATNSKYVVEFHRPGTHVTQTLQKLDGINCLLALPDPDVFNPKNIREVLESTYRRQLPVIGFSASLVNIGTLASVYASVEDYISHLLELVDAMSKGRQVPFYSHPKYWRVAVNRSVARSLNVEVPDSINTLFVRPRG